MYFFFLVAGNARTNNDKVRYHGPLRQLKQRQYGRAQYLFAVTRFHRKHTLAKCSTPLAVYWLTHLRFQWKLPQRNDFDIFLKMEVAANFSSHPYSIQFAVAQGPRIAHHDAIFDSCRCHWRYFSFHTKRSFILLARHTSTSSCTMHPNSMRFF